MGDASAKTLRRRKLRHRFYVSASLFQYPDNGQPMATIDRDTAHHMRTVLRLGEGAEVVLFDNSGQEYEGCVVESKPQKMLVRIDRAVTPKTESAVRITIGQALLKGNSLDRVLTLCTELGCTRIIPIETSRTVARVNSGDLTAKVERWERIVQEAAAQCGRVKLPRLEAPQDLKEFLERKSDGKKIILWERGGSGQLRQILEDDRIEEIMLLAGPEGGFSQVEVKSAMDAGYQIWGLGPRIMRAENAAAIALGVLQFVRGDMG